MTKPLRLAFMGSPDFAVPALDALVRAGHDIAAVYAQPPRPAGRGKQLRPTAVHARAEALGLTVRTPVSLRSGAEHQAFAELDTDVAVVAAYGLILPEDILQAPRFGCLNIHPSALPRWRGAAPVQRAVMAGDTRTAVCIMQMETGLDTGPVLLREDIAIDPAETAANLQHRLAEDGARLMVNALACIDRLSPVAQSTDGVTYATKIGKAEARIDWTRTSAEVRTHIMGLSPFPGAWCEADGERLKLLRATEEDACGPAGTVLDDAGLIACESGAIRLQRVQRAGKPAMDFEDFRRGFALPVGSILG